MNKIFLNTFKNKISHINKFINQRIRILLFFSLQSIVSIHVGVNETPLQRGWIGMCFWVFSRMKVLLLLCKIIFFLPQQVCFIGYKIFVVSLFDINFFFFCRMAECSDIGKLFKHGSLQSPIYLYTESSEVILYKCSEGRTGITDSQSGKSTII